MIRRILTLALLGMLISACGPRSLGNSIDDQFIGPEVVRAIKAAHIDLSTTTSRIMVISYNGIVLVTGQTPREELKEIAGKAAQSVANVKKCITNYKSAHPPKASCAAMMLCSPPM